MATDHLLAFDRINASELWELLALSALYGCDVCVGRCATGSLCRIAAAHPVAHIEQHHFQRVRVHPSLICQCSLQHIVHSQLVLGPVL